MVSAACSVPPSVRRAWDPKMLTSPAVQVLQLCCPSFLCPEPPPGAGVFSWVTCAGGSLSAQDPPSLSSHSSLPLLLLPLSFLSTFWFPGNCGGLSAFSCDSSYTHTHTHTPLFEQAQAWALVSLAIPTLSQDAQSGSPEAFSLSRLTFSFTAGLLQLHQELLSQGCHPCWVPESPAEL